MGFPMRPLQFVASLVAVVSITTPVTSASVITFVKSPDVIKALLTPSMTLYCGLNDTSTAAAHAVIGRDVTETADDVHFVTSMVIMRPNGDHVASVTQVTGPKVIDDQTNLKVTGSLTNSGGVESSLTLEWAYPEQSQQSVYTCEVNAMNDLGHSLTFTQQLTVEFAEPTIMDLVGHIHQQEITNINQKNLITTLQTEIKSERNKTSDLQIQVGNQQTQITNQQQELVNLKNQDTQTMSSLAKMKHIETGSLACGNSDNWPTSGNLKYHDVSHTFSSSYSNNPVVYAAVDNFSHDNANNVEFYADTLTISKTGFTIRCSTNKNHKVWSLRVRWISFYQ